YCTPAARDLVAVMLADSARIQEEEAVVAGAGVGRPPPGERQPLYTRPHPQQTGRQCGAVPHGGPPAPPPPRGLRFLGPGTTLGPAIVALSGARAGRAHRLSFTGDLGRCGLPFLRDPSPVPAADLIISESTYGGRTHDTVEGMAAKMSAVVRRTVARGGKV